MATRLTTLVVLVIVAGSLIAGLIVGAQRDDYDGPVDLIVKNGAVYTAATNGAMAEAVAIRGNQILRVGSDREILRLQRPQTIVIDAKGAAVLPGLNDARVELIEGGALGEHIDLRDAASVDDVERLVADWSAAHPDKPWVLGRGWGEDLFPDGFHVRQLLDRLVPDRPVHLVRDDSRAVWVNSVALRLAQIGKGTANPEGGTIVRDPRTGEPTGVLEESAMALVSRMIPPLTREERGRALQAAEAEAHRYGVTSVQDVSGTLDDFAMYAEARRTGALQLRIYSAVPVVGDMPDADLDALAAATAKYPDDPLFKAGAVQLRIDAAHHTTAHAQGTKTAAVTTGEPLLPPDLLNRLMRRLDARGLQIIAEASTEHGLTLALDALEHAARSNPGRTRERRHRISDVTMVAPSDRQRFGKLNILAALRPDRLPPTDAGITAPQPSAATQPMILPGARLAFGSGWPAESLNPLRAIEAALAPDAPEQDDESPRRSLRALIDAYTATPAWASFDEHRKGAIAPGLLADLVVLSANIFKGDGSALATTQVELTIFDGKVVYRRTPAAQN